MLEAVSGGHLVRHGGVRGDDGVMGPGAELSPIAAQGVAEFVGVSEQLDADVHSSVPSQCLPARRVPARKGQVYSRILVSVVFRGHPWEAFTGTTKRPRAA